MVLSFAIDQLPLFRPVFVVTMYFALITIDPIQFVNADAEFVVVADSGHLLHEEDPEDFMAVVLPFLN